MRTAFFLLLGIIFVGAAFYGLRLLWGVFSPTHRDAERLMGVENRFFRSVWERIVGWVLLCTLVCLLALMVWERLQVSGETPTDLTVAPPMTGRAIVQDTRK